MAKGNMLQGMARGKVGDIVFSRLNGEQISRVRNRNPKNPRTNAQLYQRAIMATVMQAYSAGKEIFDHSFQGKSVGAANQRRFMSLNAKKLRDQIAADIEGNVAEAYQIGRVIGPGVQSPTPCCLQVSEGTLTNTLFDGLNIVEVEEDETVKHFVERIGLKSNDLFTFVALSSNIQVDPIYTLTEVSNNYSQQYPTTFLWARYTVKTDAFTSNAVLANWGQLLEFSEGNFTPNGLDEASIELSLGFIDFVANMSVGTCAWIRSRIGEDLRSNTELVFETNAVNFGIVSKFALAAWKQGTVTLGDSDLILEGGDI